MSICKRASDGPIGILKYVPKQEVVQFHLYEKVTLSLPIPNLWGWGWSLKLSFVGFLFMEWLMDATLFSDAQS